VFAHLNRASGVTGRRLTAATSSLSALHVLVSALSACSVPCWGDDEAEELGDGGQSRYDQEGSSDGEAGSAAANSLDRGDCRDFITGNGGAAISSGLQRAGCEGVIRRVSLSHSVTQRGFEQAGMKQSHSAVRWVR
jgi:hypothetical protein